MALNNVYLRQTASGTISSASSGTATFGTPLLKGSFVLVAVGEATGGVSTHITTPTDSDGSTYSVAASPQTDATNLGVALYYCVAHPESTTPTVTCNFTGSTTGVFIIAEYLNLTKTTGSVFDPVNSSNPNNLSNTNSSPNGSSITPKTTSLYISLCVNNGGATGNASAANNNVTNASNGTLVATLFDRQAPAGSSTNCSIALSGSVTWGLLSFMTPASFMQANNYQFLKAPDGISVSEKIR